ncbi:MAG: DUF4159 domain-containing protein [Ignavibacteriaceae bacterium]|nr:DUF4159 domain-containing protein [Ignavibacteriaceae bacterium]
MMKFKFLFLFALIAFSGCDSVYKYIFLPPEKEEYVIVPSDDFIKNSKDTLYKLSVGSQSLVYDAKSWKFEIKYMSDYQLNNFEFPEESKAQEFSGNPYTYANWVDPETGVTPRRFSVFKVTIYNYTNTKINFDPEQVLLQTDRGDNFKTYAREKKNARNYSIEEYFQKLKGTSGVEDDVFETRMGIARRTMHYYGKPIYKGDSRDGLIVFDPVVEEVKRLRITIKNFVLSYDENNEPNEFTDLTFSFDQRAMTDEEILAQRGVIPGRRDSTKVIMNAALIKYNSQPGQLIYENSWNPVPRSLPNMINYVGRNSKYTVRLVMGGFGEEDVVNSKIAFIMGNGLVPELSSSFVHQMGDYINNGGTVFIDNCFFNTDYPFKQQFEDLMKSVQAHVKGKAEIKEIPLDHEIFTDPNKLGALPQGMDNFNPRILLKADHLLGLYLDGQLRVILSTKGYPVLWAEEVSNTDITKQLEFGVNLFTYAFKNK